jgi:hypothetical protein
MHAWREFLTWTHERSAGPINMLDQELQLHAARIRARRANTLQDRSDRRGVCIPRDLLHCLNRLSLTQRPGTPSGLTKAVPRNHWHVGNLGSLIGRASDMASLSVEEGELLGSLLEADNVSDISLDAAGPGSVRDILAST